ncbi:MAG: RNA-binding protein [Candidatus Nezhaarchaeales archaeon]|nr:MAG: RNA-binding protein [Candidatus Nezhaarchaeota archaeon WYZ-LMO7]TDA36361.1 MAG: RNA-binding protein [Candidatus Nezhaarchaeota archaeon WYZ-LMO8]
MSKAHRRFLSKSESKEIVSAIEEKFKLKATLDRKSRWEVVQVGKDECVYVIDGEPIIMKISGKLIPSLKALSNGLIELPKIVVDLGAVKHIVNGADVMAPGIVKVQGEFARDDLVVVIDEKHGKPLCIGVAIVSSSEVASMSRGKVVKNLHHVGDKIWSKLKDLGLM